MKARLDASRGERVLQMRGDGDVDCAHPGSNVSKSAPDEQPCSTVSGRA